MDSALSENPEVVADSPALRNGSPPRAALAAPTAHNGQHVAPLEVVVLNADLKFVDCPLLVGHYRSTSLTGAEAAIDLLMDRRMSRSMSAGLYPGAPGSHQVFGNCSAAPGAGGPAGRSAVVVVAGLGDEGELRPVDLCFTVRQAILAFAQRLFEQDQCADFSLAATLIGSGGSGISAGCSAQSIVQAAHEANLKLQQAEGWPQLRQLTLIELFLERATDAWHALQMQEQSDRKLLGLKGKIQLGRGALRRPLDHGYRGTSYDFISALQQSGPDLAHPGIAYKLDTKRARAEVHAHRAQATLLRELVAKASNTPTTDPKIGRTLFNLLIPVEMEPFLGGSSELVIELDAATAGIPWELLDTNADNGAADERPWAIRSKLIRKLQLERFRTTPQNASTEDNVLIIGNPKCFSDDYASLEGAKLEAMAVAGHLQGPGSGLAREQVTLLASQDDAQSILIALLKKPYRIVHVAGHGEFGAHGGVVLSTKDTYLGANEVGAMRTIPELVFLNCCHLSGLDSANVLRQYDRAQFAASTAEALIRIGVRCVVAAGWAVEDHAAKEFASAFYVALLNGARFIEAVGFARNAAYKANPQSNTWAAYQCYGDPEWRWRRGRVPEKQRAAAAPQEEFGGIASPAALAIALETLAIQSHGGDAEPEQQRAKLDYLDVEFGGLWGHTGAIADAFGFAFACAGDIEKSIAWYRRALNAADGCAPLRAAEQLARQLEKRAASGRGDPASDTGEAAEWIDRVAAFKTAPPANDR